MSRIPLVDSDAPAASHTLLQEIRGAFGTAPNMFKAVANSPAALAMMWAGFGALSGGRLGALLGEKIAVAVANRNTCEYCLAAHTVLGRNAGASGGQMEAAQIGRADDARTQAALDFALAVVEGRGKVDAGQIEALRKVGFDDGEIVELLAHVALNLFTNYVNLAFEVPLDFPAVPLRSVG